MANPPTNHKSLTGLVTKLVGDGETYGFINDEIFFPQTNVAGGPASVGDQVFAECEYSAHLPIKWSATSLKIIKKASGQEANNNSASNQQQQTQHLHQQQQPFNQSTLPNTYQQQQQPQQSHMMDLMKPQNNDLRLGTQQNQQQPILPSNPQNDQQQLTPMTNPGEIFGPASTRPQTNFPQQTSDSNIQPFQDQPMGPPNFAFTSQLGSAFVQNQFVPSPFLTQQPPPTLLQPPPQHLLSSNPMNNQQQRNNQRNQHNNNGNNNNNNNMNNNNRFNNNQSQDNKNVRRNMNRYDNNNKFDRSRSGERDDSNNNRQNKNDSRDRSTGRSSSKRDGSATRSSPPPHSSAKSTSSVGSDKSKSASVNKNRRHYEVQNIPRAQIMNNINSHNIKQRCPSSVHVPSDLKSIFVNSYFRLNLKTTPKPIQFDIKKFSSEDKDSHEQQPQETIAQSTDIKQSEEVAVATEVQPETDMTKTLSNDLLETETEPSKEIETTNILNQQEQATPPSSKSDIRLNHKYGVKVLLLSLPDFETIYNSIFGENLDSFGMEGKHPYKKLDEIISLLCNKGSNNGYSLIGGKFDPITDGFVEGESNEFERNGRKPDLIATCKRVVKEQMGLDLSNCRSWNLISTFMYNNKSDYFSPKASIEYSYIYMPDLWTLLSDKFEAKEFEKEIFEKTEEKQITSDNNEETKNTPNEESSEVRMESEDTNLPPIKETTTPTTDDTNQQGIEDITAKADDTDQPVEQANRTTEDNNESDEDLKVLEEKYLEKQQPIPDPDNWDFRYEEIEKMYVPKLKSYLHLYDVDHNDKMKKSELVGLLQKFFDSCAKIQKRSKEIKPEVEQVDEENQDSEMPQLEEGEVLPGPSETNSPDLPGEDDNNSADGRKRKASDAECPTTTDNTNKKLCSGKKNHVNLIKEAFIVKTRDQQQQLSLVPLHEAIQAGRYDQFELSVASNVLKESLIQHFSEYILTTLVEDQRQKMSSSNPNTASSQETNSDSTNSNNNKSKNPTTTTATTSIIIDPKEYQVDRYINLAFSYFDSTHMGYVYFDDLNKLFNNTGLTISKRALTALIGDGEKFNYKTLPDLSSKLAPTYLYEFPAQFTRLPLGISMTDTNDISTCSNVKLVEHKGVVYDVEKLIQQVKDAETLNVSLVDRFNYAIENSDKQLDEINVLEVNQKSLSRAIKGQNEEICQLKRERDNLKKRNEQVKEFMKVTMESFGELVKEKKI